MCRRMGLEGDRGGGELFGILGRRKWYVGLGGGGLNCKRRRLPWAWEVGASLERQGGRGIVDLLLPLEKVPKLTTWR